MAEAYDAPMPPALDLGDGYTLRLTAIDPTSGNTVSGITVANMVLFSDLLGDTAPGDLAFGPFALVPGPGA
jgi:hypothetical protein